ncbi:type IV secretory system conjugative DNA transfer family protein [Leucobacter aridicollis]|uniref:type IV secretory system conjugative DNA transfer family protein n=1 Tax=Leucobacter aridicollis TaxID=283878 RepID=UPI002168376D|nr:type IV secretory system conjugative DNA transfer family protein [Leucobacter aridicollis]
MRDTLALPRLDATLRIGVCADDPKRQAAATYEMFGALQLIESSGSHLTLTRDPRDRWTRGKTGRQPFRLTADQVLPLLMWPLGDQEYPGIVSTHPRRLPAAEILPSNESVFASATAPGPARMIGLDPISRLQHVVVLGPTGSGKSTLLEHLILSDISAGRACVVIEPKKQLIDSILKRVPSDKAGQIVVMDPLDLKAPVGLNPLDIGDRDPSVVVDGILAALAAVFSDGWGPRTEYLIHGALLTLALAGQARRELYTLLDLPRILTDTPFRRSVVVAVKDDPTLAQLWSEFDDMRPGQRAAVVAAPLNKLRRLIMRKHLAAVLGQTQPRFRFRDVFRERKTVLVPLNESLIGSGAAALLGSLIVAELFMAAQERAAEAHPQRRPGMVFIDELQNYLHLPTPIDTALGIFRSFGVGLHLAHQHRGQLPPGMRTALDSNARNKISFQLEADDARDMARQSRILTADDFQSLPQHEIYARLLGKGVLTEWRSARTLKPPSEVGADDVIRQASRDAFGALPSEPVPVSEPSGEQ